MIDKKEIIALEEWIKKDFQDVMPKRYWLFPTIPNVYSLLNGDICIQMPAFGPISYRIKLKDLRDYLNENFIMDVLHDGSIIFILKDKK